MSTKNVAAVCIAKSLKAANYHHTEPGSVPRWNLTKMVEQAWKMGVAAYDLEIIEAWAGGQYYGSFRVHDIHEMEDRRKAFSVAPIWGARSVVGDAFKFKRGALQYFSKKSC
jgi:hypothetical protein